MADLPFARSSSLPQVVEQYDGLDNSDFWELVGILYSGPMHQEVYEGMVMKHAGGEVKIRHGKCGKVFVIERDP